MLKKLPPALRTLWLIITMVLGVVFVWMMVRVYNSIDTVPTWYSVWTPLGFFLTLFMGAATGLSAAAHRGRERLGDASVACGVGAGAGDYCHYGGHAGRGTGDDSQFHSAGVCSGAGLWFADGLAYGAACGGVVLLDCATVKGYQPAVPLLSVAFILMLAGELIGRGVFYGLHMTVGMAVAS